MAFFIRAATPADGWKRVVRYIMGHGRERVDERGLLTRWLDNLMVCVRDPFTERVPEGYPFSERVLRERYATQILDPNPMGFDYTYGERLMSWGQEAIDQIDYVIRKLSQSPNSRRAVATTWDPRRDTVNDEVPCLNHFVFMVRDGAVDLSVMIRSNDMYGAWPANVFALGELLSRVATETGLDRGTVTTLSVNAHIYEHDWERASMV